MTHSSGWKNQALIHMMLRRNCTGKELAASVGISRSMISELCNAIRSPSLETALRICSRLDCGIGELWPPDYFARAHANRRTMERNPSLDPACPILLIPSPERIPNGHTP